MSAPYHYFRHQANLAGCILVIFAVIYYVMLKKGTKLYSIFKNKCPQCQEAEMFHESNPYRLKQLTQMHQRCPKCGKNFVPEPGFYFGAAYVSYGLSVALGVAIFVALSVLFNDLSAEVYLAAIVGAIVILMPLNYRLSRLIWINFFVKYKKTSLVD